MKKIIFIIFLAFALTACSEIESLDNPNNIRIEEKILKWDEVINADSYNLKIKNQVFVITNNFYDVSHFEPGEYIISIQAISDKFEKSLWVPYKFVIESPKLSAPSNIKIEDYVLKWDEVKNATGYIIKYIYNDKEKLEEIATNSYDIEKFINANYKIYIKAFAHNYKDSDYTLIDVVLEKPTLDSPKSLTVNQKIVRWNRVDNATDYLVKINEMEREVATNTIDLTDLPNGEYTIMIKAMARRFIDSDYFSSLVFLYEFRDEVPTNISIANSLLSWTAIKDAETYIININGKEEEIYINKYDLKDLEKNKFYLLKVKTKDGEYSQELKYDTFELSSVELDIIYNKNSNEDISLDLNDYNLEIQKIVKENKVAFTNYTYNDYILVFPNNYLKDLDYTNYIYYMYTSIGKVKLTIMIVDDRKPYIISNNNIDFDYNDIILDFEIYDGKIISISGNGITSYDYEIIKNKIIIKKEYLIKTFNQNQERKMLILGYHLSSNTNDVIGFVFIVRKD